jgi:tol-pal system protein YbgF
MRLHKALEAFLKTKALLCALFMVSACASTQETDIMRADINDLKVSSYEMKKELAALKKSIEGMGMDESLSALREAQAGIFTQLQDMQKDIQFLRGRLDENKYFTEKTLKQDESEIELIKAQLDKLDTGSKELALKLAAIESALNELKKSQPEAEAGGQPTAEAAGEKAPSTPEKEYDSAYGLYKEKKYKEARDALSAFIKNFPDHELAGNAQFWIAETYYADRDFENAILSYEDVIKKYKTNRKVPAAFLKQAFAFVEIGDKKAAKGILKELIGKYPGTEEAKSAEAKLKEL